MTPTSTRTITFVLTVALSPAIHAATLQSVSLLLDQVAIAPLRIAFADNIAALESPKELQRQLEIYTQASAELAAVAGISQICDRIERARLDYAIKRGVTRAKLGLAWHADGAPTPSKRGLDGFSGANAWYRHYLQAWLGADVDPNDIRAFGLDELTRALAQRDALIAAAGRRPRDAVKTTDEEQVLNHYFELRDTVERQLPNLFHHRYGVRPAIIAASGRGASFPAPGYYQANPGTFFFNSPEEDGYDLATADWLYLHEATPGHHLLFQATHRSDCPDSEGGAAVYAYIEGWAAYVETLGSELGLYKTLEKRVSAIDWNIVRSARVVLDVSLNDQGWTDQQALDFWLSRLPASTHSIAAREIARMRHWPVQVISYKYGARAFLDERARMADTLGERFDIRDFHDLVMRYGEMPLAAFRQLVSTSIEDALSDTTR